MWPAPPGTLPRLTACPAECDKSFTRSDALAKHMRMQHNIIPPAPGRGGNRKRKREEPEPSDVGDGDAVAVGGAVTVWVSQTVVAMARSYGVEGGRKREAEGGGVRAHRGRVCGDAAQS